MKRAVKLIPVILSLFCVISCSGELSVQPKGNDAVVTFSAQPGKAFLDIFGSLTGFEASGEDETFFDKNKIEESLEENDFHNISVECRKNGYVFISFSSKLSDIPFISDDGKVQFSKTSFQEFYKLIPENFQSALDMLMSPTFTNEVMTDEEYLDLLGSVYGKAFEAELSGAQIKLQNKNVKLVEILNLQE